MFMSKNPKPQLTLADVLREKFTEKRTEIQTQFSDNGSKFTGCHFHDSDRNKIID